MGTDSLKIEDVVALLAWHGDYYNKRIRALEKENLELVRNMAEVNNDRQELLRSQHSLKLLNDWYIENKTKNG